MSAPLLSLILSVMNLGTIASAAPCDLAISSVSVIDVEDRQVHKDMDVLITGGKISAVEEHREGPRCRAQIDGKGKYLMPGIVDMHVHANAIYLPRDTDYTKIKNTIPLKLKQSGAMLLRAGVTAFLDLCSVPQDEIFEARNKQRAGQLDFDMPDIYSAGSCITSKWYNRTGDPNQFNDEKQIADVTLLEKVDTYKKAYPRKNGVIIYGYEVEEKNSELKKIEALLAKKPDVLKVFYTSSWDKGARYPSLHVNTIKKIVKMAHKKNVPVLAHALDGEEHEAVLNTGIDGFAHGAYGFLPSEFEEFKRFSPSKPLLVIPTLSVFNGLGRLGTKRREWSDPLLSSVLNAADPLIRERVFFEFKNMDEKLKEDMDHLEDIYWMLYKDDMIPNLNYYRKDPRYQVVMGSDASNLGIFLGFSAHQELDSMVSDIGYTSWDALAAATVIPGKFLKAKYGTKPGDVANLLLLEKSPIRDIRATRSIDTVILRGKPLRFN